MSAYTSLIRNVTMGDCRTLFTLAAQTEQPEPRTVLTGAITKLHKHIKSEKMSFTDWHTTLQGIYDSLGTIGFDVTKVPNDLFRIGFSFHSLAFDIRYDKSLEKCKDKELSYVDSITLLHRYAGEINDILPSNSQSHLTPKPAPDLPTKPMSKTKVGVRVGAEGGKVTKVAEGQSPLDWTLSHCVPTSPTEALATLMQQGSATSSDTNQSRPTQTRPLYQGLVSQRRRQPPQPLQLLLLYSPAHVSHGPKTHHATVATAASTNTRHTCLLTTPLHTSLWGTSSSSTSISETAYAPNPTLVPVSLAS